MFPQSRFGATAIVGCVVCFLGLQCIAAAEEKSEFARATIDLGVVPSDIAASVKFYTEAIGFKEISSFSVPAEFGADIGLTDNRALTVHMLTLGDADSATKLKLLEVPGAKMKSSDNAFINSQLGFRYLTIFVADTDVALARLRKAGVKPLAKGPMALPAGLPPGLVVMVVRDPDGNLIELIGPKH
jgi:lactoylglutathione lyase